MVSPIPCNTNSTDISSIQKTTNAERNLDRYSPDKNVGFINLRMTGSKRGGS